MFEAWILIDPAPVVPLWTQVVLKMVVMRMKKREKGKRRNRRMSKRFTRNGN